MYWKKDKDKKRLQQQALKQPPTARTERRGLLWEWKERSVYKIYIEREKNLEGSFLEFIFLSFFKKSSKHLASRLLVFWDTKLVGQAIWVVLTNCVDNCIKNTHTRVNQHHVWFFFFQPPGAGWRGGGGLFVLFLGIECFQFSSLVFCHLRCWHVRNDISQSVASDTGFLRLAPIGTRSNSYKSDCWHTYVNICIFHTIVETPYFNCPQLAECYVPDLLFLPPPLSPKRNIFLFVSADFLFL